jgi:hypothetical protein
MTDDKKTRELAPANQKDNELTFDGHGRLTGANLNGLWRLATVYSNSKLVPDHFRNSPNDCFIALQMAMRCRVDPFAFLQSCYTVHGKPGVEAKLAIAILNASGQIRGRIKYKLEGTGDKRRCTASAIVAETGDEVSHTVSMEQAVAEGWTKKNGSKWLTLPDLMLRYRSAIFLIRTTFPEVLMGLLAIDELQDIDGSTVQPMERVPKVGRSTIQVPTEDAEEEEQGEEVVVGAVEDAAGDQLFDKGNPIAE